MTRRVRLYCFPHSGATTSVYRSWPERFGPDVVIRPIERPGRGRLSNAPAVGSLDELIETSADLVSADLAEDPGTPWMTFGHSFGSVLGVATAALAGDRPPLAAIVSAGLPPPLHSPVDEASGLSDEQLRDQIIEIGGTPPALLDPGPVRDQILRCFREDHARRAEFRGVRDLKVAFPLGIVSADGDEYAPPAAMAAWADHTTTECRQRTVPGGHFAVMRDPEPVRDLVRRLRHPHHEGQVT